MNQAILYSSPWASETAARWLGPAMRLVVYQFSGCGLGMAVIKRLHPINWLMGTAHHWLRDRNRSRQTLHCLFDKDWRKDWGISVITLPHTSHQRYLCHRENCSEKTSEMLSIICFTENFARYWLQAGLSTCVVGAASRWYTKRGDNFVSFQ